MITKSNDVSKITNRTNSFADKFDSNKPDRKGLSLTKYPKRLRNNTNRELHKKTEQARSNRKHSWMNRIPGDCQDQHNKTHTLNLKPFIVTRSAGEHRDEQKLY